MAGPVWNLVWFALLIVVVSAAFWPRSGLIPRLKRERAVEKRVLTEDALKHVFHNEQRGQTCTLASIGGALEISPDEAVSVVTRMKEANLVDLRDGRITLSGGGERYALQVIRAHRLWERYLADETGVAATNWHAEAEQREHTLSKEEADALAQRLGNPRFDPHGDPIPTADGTVHGEEASLLSNVGAGGRVRVVHVEDEPEVVYQQIVAVGIYPGMVMHVLEHDDRRVLCSAEGREFALAPLVAANVSVVSFEMDVADPESPDADGTLRDLSAGEVATVVRLSPACRGAERRRLMDLGIVPGTRIAFERHGLSGGLTAYLVRGTLVALREEQTEMISIQRVRKESA